MCSVCGTEFYRSPSIVKNSPDLTCSRACAAVNRLTGETRHCKICDKEFYALKRDIDKGFGIYCSNACNGLAYRKQIKVRCTFCSAEIDRVKNEVDTRAMLFCDADCRNNWQRRFRPNLTKKFTQHQTRQWKGDACVRCGSTEKLELDHVIPRFMGGPTTKENSQTLCQKCNMKKKQEDLATYSDD